MISTAAQIIEVNRETLFNPMTARHAINLIDARHADTDEEFIHALHKYSAHIIAHNASKLINLLLDEGQLSDLNATIAEINEMEKSVYGE